MTTHDTGELILGRLVGHPLVRRREGNGFGIRGEPEARREEEGQVLSSGECHGLSHWRREDLQVRPSPSGREGGRRVQLGLLRYVQVKEERRK